MYLFELVADDLCGMVTSLRGRRRWRALPLLGSAWWPGLGAAGCLYEWLWRAKPWVRAAMRQGPSGLASSGVLPADGVVAMWAGTIQARSFSFELIAHGQSRRRRRLFPGPGQV
jgi:hypothetical protein